jgi:hypothetical protein
MRKLEMRLRSNITPSFTPTITTRHLLPPSDKFRKEIASIKYYHIIISIMLSAVSGVLILNKRFRIVSFWGSVPYC